MWFFISGNIVTEIGNPKWSFNSPLNPPVHNSSVHWAITSMKKDLEFKLLPESKISSSQEFAKQNVRTLSQHLVLCLPSSPGTGASFTWEYYISLQNSLSYFQNISIFSYASIWYISSLEEKWHYNLVFKRI